MALLGKKKIQKKVSTVPPAFSLGCCRNVGQLWQRAPTWSLRHWRALGGARGWREAGTRWGQHWGAAANCSWRTEACKGITEALCLEHGLRPSGLFVPELFLAVIFHWALAQRTTLCGELLSSQAVGSVALVGPAVSLHCSLGRSKFPCWAVWTSDFGGIFSLIFPFLLSASSADPCTVLKLWKAKHCIIQYNVHKRTESSRWLFFFPISSTD